jgi:hypothetical protein
MKTKLSSFASMLSLIILACIFVLAVLRMSEIDINFANSSLFTNLGTFNVRDFTLLLTAFISGGVCATLIVYRRFKAPHKA